MPLRTETTVEYYFDKAYLFYCKTHECLRVSDNHEDSELLQEAIILEMQKRYEEEAPEGTKVKRHAKFLLNNGVQMIYGPKTYHTPTSFSIHAGVYKDRIENSEYSYSNAKENITPMKTEMTLKDVFSSLNNLMLNN